MTTIEGLLGQILRARFGKGWYECYTPPSVQTFPRLWGKFSYDQYLGAAFAFQFCHYDPPWSSTGSECYESGQYYACTEQDVINQILAYNVSNPYSPADLKFLEASLVSCTWQENIIAGQPAQITITVNRGSVSENYKLVFSGDFIGESPPFLVSAGTGQLTFTASVVFPTGVKTITASLVKA